MKDERVRPNVSRKTKKGWKYSIGNGKYNHVKMEGQSVPVNEPFTLPSGATAMSPGMSGIAGEDINCRCFVSYEVRKRFENAPKNNSLIKGGKGSIMKPRLFKMNIQLFAEKDLKNQSSSSLKKAIRNFEKRISEHKEYIRNPVSHCPDWETKDPRGQQGLIKHWKKEISNFNESIQNRIDELKKRGEY